MGIDNANGKNLIAVLRTGAVSLKSIALAAPYVGLAGTCVVVLSALRWSGSVEMEENTFLALMAAKIAAALITTAAGIFVAVPATCSYNYLCTCINSVESEVSNDLRAQIGLCRQGDRRLVLTKRFSQLPAFALIAAPGLAVLVVVYTPYLAPREASGLKVELGSTTCEHDGTDRLIVLHITDAGKLFLNTEQEDWDSFAGRLSKIYSVRVHRTLYLLADDGVPFQTVADVLDAVENIPATAGPQGLEKDKLDITVRLLTPKAAKNRCPQVVETSSVKHAPKVVGEKSPFHQLPRAQNLN